MNYKTDNENFKDSILFRCNCGEWCFLEIGEIEFDKGQFEYYFEISFIPRTFWEKLKYLFKIKAPNQLNKDQLEIILYKEDMEEMYLKLKEWAGREIK